MMRALAQLAYCGAALAVLGCADAPPAPPPAALAEPVQGQWIWTARDARLLQRARAVQPALAAAILIGHLECETGGVRFRRGLSPRLTGDAPRALVIRLEDSVHRCFDRLGDEELFAALDGALASTLREVVATGVRFEELQLDYDAPSAKLERYAHALRYVAQRSLAGVELWITSIPVHLEHPRYGRLLQGAVKGHVLQLFDTQLPCEPGRAERLHQAAEQHGLPYRTGLGAFEREGDPERRTHGCWAGLQREWQRRSAAGFWVFPAGIAYERRLDPRGLEP